MKYIISKSVLTSETETDKKQGIKYSVTSKSRF